MQRTGNGLQVLLRCPNAGGNRKLAWMAADNAAGRSVAIETRGDGGYIVGPPSVHPNGNIYEIVHGDITELPPLDQASADLVLELAENLCEAPLSKHEQQTFEKAMPRTTSYRSNGSTSVIDKFNETYDVVELLENCGYERRGRRLIRPNYDKDSQPGVIVGTRDGKKVTFHFSSNDPLSEGGHTHDAFSAFCILQHNGDVKKAVRIAAGRLGIAYEPVPERTSDGELVILPGGNLTIEAHAAPTEGAQAGAAAVSKGPAFAGPPIALNDPSPPPVPAQLIRGAIGDFLEAAAEHTETPRELTLAFGLGVLGTVCQGRFSVRVEDGYFEALSAWVIAAMEPGNRKTAAMKCAIGPLIRWEREKAIGCEKEIKAAESATKTIKARVDRLRQKAASADPMQFLYLSKEIETLEATMLPIPTPPRLMGDDVTPEHLATLMASQGERLGILADEGGIFETIAGRYSNNVPNLDIYLKSYSGSHVRVDRGSRPSIAMDHPTLTVALSPQPDVLRGLADKPGFKGRGLLDRFLYMLPQSRLGYRKLEVRPIPGDVEREYHRAVYELLDVPSAINESGQPVPHVLQFTTEAYQRWKAWQKVVETMVRPREKLEVIKGWASKLPGATARVAALMHCAEFTSRAAVHPGIGSETVERAIDFASILIDHALAAFASMGAIDSVQAARRLWEVIERGRFKSFTARDAWNPLRGTYKRVVDVEDGFEVLIDRNYILPLDADDRPRKRGRPSRRFIVNPTINEA